MLYISEVNSLLKQSQSVSGITCVICYFQLESSVNIPQHFSSIKIASMLVSIDDALAFPKRFQVIAINRAENSGTCVKLWQDLPMDISFKRFW